MPSFFFLLFFFFLLLLITTLKLTFGFFHLFFPAPPKLALRKLTPKKRPYLYGNLEHFCYFISRPNFGVLFSSVNLTNFCQLLEFFPVFLDITKLRGVGGIYGSKLKTLIFWGLGKKKEKKGRGENT